MPRKVLDVRKECVRLSCQRQTKSPLGLSVGGLFAYRHAPERLTSRTLWNKSSAYVSDTHYKSEVFKSVILSVLYHIRHFDVFVVKRKTLTFVKVIFCVTTINIHIFGAIGKEKGLSNMSYTLICPYLRANTIYNLGFAKKNLDKPRFVLDNLRLL